MTTSENNNYPLVTVITPTYNRGKDYLVETINSVLAQNYPNFEYIVLDDGSTDNTQEVLASYTDPRMQCEAHSNMGEPGTVNKGFGLANGKYIVIVNSDDPLLPDHLGLCVDFMENHTNLLVGYPDWIMIDEQSQKVKVVQVEEYSYAKLLGQLFCLPGPAPIIRSDIIQVAGERDPNFRYTGDYEHWLRIGLHGAFSRIPHTLGTHRVHSGRLTSQYLSTDMGNEFIKVLDKIFKHPKITETERKLSNQAYGSAYYTLAMNSLTNQRQAAYYFWKSIISSPINCYPQGKSRSWHIMLRYIINGYTPESIKYPFKRSYQLLKRLLSS